MRVSDSQSDSDSYGNAYSDLHIHSNGDSNRYSDLNAKRHTAAASNTEAPPNSTSAPEVPRHGWD